MTTNIAKQGLEVTASSEKEGVKLLFSYNNSKRGSFWFYMSGEQALKVANEITDAAKNTIGEFNK